MARWSLLRDPWRGHSWSDRKRCAAAKDALGRVAAGLVREGETVVLDSGTTTQYIARHLAARRDLVVVTASLAVLEELAGSTGIQVRLTGGVYRRTSHDLCGSAVDEALGNIYADRVFFGAAALSFHKRSDELRPGDAEGDPASREAKSSGD